MHDDACALDQWHHPNKLQNSIHGDSNNSTHAVHNFPSTLNWLKNVGYAVPFGSLVVSHFQLLVIPPVCRLVADAVIGTVL